MALIPSNRAAKKNPKNPRNWAGMEDDFFVVSQTWTRRAVYTEGEDWGVVVILFLRITLQSWRHFMDILHHHSSGLGSSALQACRRERVCGYPAVPWPPPSSPNPAGSSKQAALKWAPASSAATASRPTKQGKDTSRTRCPAAEARSFLHGSERAAHQLDPHSLTPWQHTPARHRLFAANAAMNSRPPVTALWSTPWLSSLPVLYYGLSSSQVAKS